MCARARAAAWIFATSIVASVAEAREQGLCRADPPADRLSTRDATLGAAQAQVHPFDRPRGRSLFFALLAHDPDDDDAAIGLARLDEWDGCTALAERGYRDVLRRTLNHVEARAGLVDLLMREGRWDDAERELEQGLRLMPIAPELLARRARLAYLRGDPQGAVRDLTEAERVSPADPEIRAARMRVVLGQARVGQRVQLFPSGYDDVETTDVSLMQRWRRIRFELGVVVAARQGAERPTRNGLRPTNIVDGRPSAGAYVHLRNGGWVGASLAVAMPALALPRFAFDVSGMTPLTSRISGYLTVAYWIYADDREVIVGSPAVSAPLTDAIDVTIRYWSTSVVTHVGGRTDAQTVHSLGLRGGYRVDEQLTLGLDYTYGVQLERLAGAADLLDLRSHVFTISGRRRLSRFFGVDGALSLERRESLRSGAFVWGPALEAGVFARW